VPRRASDRILEEYLLSRRDVDPAAAAVDSAIAAAFLDWVRDDQAKRLTAAGVRSWIETWTTRSNRGLRDADLGRVPGALTSLVRFLAQRGDLDPGEAERIASALGPSSGAPAKGPSSPRPKRAGRPRRVRAG
jgi:hypothetical protein